MFDSVVIMGVSGCGKSSLAAGVAQAEDMVLLEGDDRHSAENRDKMARGVALTDADRHGWLATLADELRRRPRGTVLSCSALRRAYRDQLRQAAPGLGFVFMEIERNAAAARVAARPAHFFSASLVDNQFATLEPPLGEPGVLRVDAVAALSKLQAQVSAWLRNRELS